MSGKKKWITVAAISLVIIASYFSVKSYYERTARNYLNAFTGKIKDKVVITFDDLNVSPLTRAITIKKAVISRPDIKHEIKIQTVVINKLDADNAAPHELDIQFSNFLIPSQSLGGGLTELLHKTNYPILAGDLNVSWSFEKYSKKFHLINLSVNVKDAFELAISADLENVEWDLIGEDNGLKSFLAAFPNYSLASAKIKYIEEGFHGRLQTAAAEDMSMSERDYRKRLSENISRDLSAIAASDQNKQVVNALERFKTFVIDRTNLVISANPEQPVPAAEIFKWRTFSEAVVPLNIEIQVQ